MATTQKAKRMAEKREVMLEFLKERGKVQYIFDTIEKLEKLEDDIEPAKVQRLKAAMDARIGLLKKFMPDVKALEIEANVTTESHEEWIARLK